MTSAATTPARGTGGRHAEGHGLIVFASVVLLVLGCFNLIDGIAAIAKSHVFIGNARYVFGDLSTWGWVALILGVLQLLAAAGVLAGNQWARWFGVAVVGLNALGQMAFIPAYPFWSLTIIAVDVVALWGYAPTVAARNWPPSAASPNGPQPWSLRPVRACQAKGPHGARGSILPPSSNGAPAGRAV